jgi:hypothetical protein
MHILALLFAACLSLACCDLSAAEPSCQASPTTGGGHCQYCSACREREPLRGAWYVPVAPPIGPIVESIPIATPAAVLAQDRLLIATTRVRLRSFEPEGAVRRAAPADCRGLSHGLSEGDALYNDRIERLERDVDTLADAIGKLERAVRAQTDVIRGISARLKE